MSSTTRISSKRPRSGVMGGQFRLVLEAALRNPDARVGDLPMTEESETAGLVDAFNEVLQ